MATYLKGIVFDNQTMTPKAFGRAMENALSDGTLSGCAVTFSGTNVTLGSGYLIAKGRVIEATSNTTVATSPTYANGYGRLMLKIDLSETSSSTINHQAQLIVDYSSTTTFPSLVQDDINGSGTVYEVALGIFKYTSGSITEMVESIGRTTPKEGLTANKAVATSADGNLVASSASATELGYLAGVTSAVQTQLNGKQKTIRYGSSIPSDLQNGEIFLLIAE